jgi:hypothetical protein
VNGEPRGCRTLQLVVEHVRVTRVGFGRMKPAAANDPLPGAGRPRAASLQGTVAVRRQRLCRATQA